MTADAFLDQEQDSAESFLDQEQDSAESFLDAAPSSFDSTQSFENEGKDAPSPGSVESSMQDQMARKKFQADDSRVSRKEFQYDEGQPAVPSGPQRKQDPLKFSGMEDPVRLLGDKVHFDPNRFSEGVKFAWENQLIDAAQYALLQPAADEFAALREEREALEARAGYGSKGKAYAKGVTKGTAMTVGALGLGVMGTGAGAVTGPFAPVAAPVFGIIGGVVGALGAGKAYDDALEGLAANNAMFDSILASAELNPNWSTAGELTSFAAPAALGVRALARGAQAVAADRGKREAAMFVSKVTGIAGAGGATFDPAARAMERATTPDQSPAEVLVEGEREQIPIFDAGGMLTSAAAGAFTGGLAVGKRKYSQSEVWQILKMPASKRNAAQTAVVKRANELRDQFNARFPDGYRANISGADQTTFLGNPEATRLRGSVAPTLRQLPPTSTGVSPATPPAALPPSRTGRPAPSGPPAVYTGQNFVTPRSGSPGPVRQPITPGAESSLTYQPFAELLAAAPAPPAPPTALARNATVPEQMTPDEADASDLKLPRGRSADILPSMDMMVGGTPVSERTGGVDSPRYNHAIQVATSARAQTPVSAEAVDTYGIKLPDGYVKQGDLYVYQPETAPAPAAPQRNATVPEQMTPARINFFYGKSRYGNLRVKAPVGTEFSPENLQTFKSLGEKHGWTVYGAGEGSSDVEFGISTRSKVTGEEGFRLLEETIESLKSETQADKKQREKDETSKAEKDNREGERQSFIAEHPKAKNWIDSVFGSDNVNSANRVSLIKFLEGIDRKYKGAVNRDWEGGLKGLNAVSSSGMVDWNAVKKAYQERTPESTKATARDTTLPEQMTPEKGDEAFVKGGDARITRRIDNIFLAEGKQMVLLQGLRDPLPLESIIVDFKSDYRLRKQKKAERGSPVVKLTPGLIRQLGDIAVKNKQPVPQDYIDAVGGRIPEGYVKQGDIYVYQPETTPGPAAPQRDQTQMFAGSLPTSGGGSSPGPAPRPTPPPTALAWLANDPETPKGRQLVSKILDPKRRGGMREVVNFVNDVVGVEMRRSNSQTTKKHPAHYRLRGHLAFTRRTQSQINFHEAGHGLKELIESRMPGELDKYESAWLALTKLPGSMASAQNVHEGVADWMRLRIMEPAAVESLAVTPIIETLTEQFYPGIMAGVRDAARAMNRFQSLPVAQRWAAFTRANEDRPTLGTILNTLATVGNAAANAVASGAPVSRIDRAIYRAIIANRSEIGANNRAAHALARDTRNLTTELNESYNMILQIGAETQKAISGRGEDRGVRVMDENNRYRMILPETWRDIVQRVPSKQWPQFQEAGWALESLNRYAKDRLEYPGMREGITPADLKAIVDKAEGEIPDFRKHFASVQKYFDAILDVKELGGLKKPGETAKMRQRGLYWPLPRVMRSLTGSSGPVGADISAGDYRARGSDEAIQDLTTVAEARTRDALTSYYWNRFGLTMVKNLGRIADDKRLPMEARALAGQTITRMKMPTAVAATVSREEVQAMVYKAVLEQRAADLGISPEILAATFTPDDINLTWEFKDLFRPTRPTDVNVISLLRNGEREFYQLGDAALFSMFARPENVSKVMQAISWALGPSMQNWKRNITQSLSFALLGNLPGDIINQIILNRDAIGWVPGGATMIGVWNKFSKKYPQVFQEGLLLSRVEPSSVELVNAVKHNAVWQWLTEGFYISTAKDPTARLLLTLLQPSILLFPLWKLGDLVNLITGGRTLAPLFESATREGAAVWNLMRGGSDQSAMDAYWRVTGRFNEHPGTGDARVAFSTPGFFNPMMQAVRNAGQILSDPDPRVSGPFWAKLLIMVPSIFGAGAVLRYLTMSEDERERERQRPLEDRLNYYDVAGLRLRFPYGPEGAMATFVYNSVMDDLLDRPKADGKKTGIMMLKRIADPGNPLQFLGPQLNSITEAQMNWSNFQQRHIVSPWLIGLPASKQYASTTPEFYRKLGLWADYSPDKLQYIMRGAVSRQADDIIRLLDRVESNRPIQELADVPFVARLFIKDPIGFGSDAMRRYGEVEERLQLLNRRLSASGYRWVRDADYNALAAQPDLLALRTQIDALEYLRTGSRELTRLSQVGKYFRIGQDWENERNMRVVMTRFAQAVLTGNGDEVERIQQAVDLLQQIEPASPAAQQQDYWENR